MPSCQFFVPEGTVVLAFPDQLGQESAAEIHAWLQVMATQMQRRSARPRIKPGPKPGHGQKGSRTDKVHGHVTQQSICETVLKWKHEPLKVRQIHEFALEAGLPVSTFKAWRATLGQAMQRYPGTFEQVSRGKWALVEWRTLRLNTAEAAG